MCILFGSSKAKNVKTLNIEGWEYSYVRDSRDGIFNVVPDQETIKRHPVPKTFFKYYGMSKNSVDALTGLYIYASHPNQMNDSIDCDARIVRLDSRGDIDVLLQGYTTYKDLLARFGSEHKVYESSGEVLKILSFKKMGILSLTETCDNQALWSYYTDNEGFCLEFDVGEFHFQTSGPFPVHYMKDLVSISAKKWGIQIGVLVQVNEKKECWKHENEWRMLVFSPDGQDMQAYDKDRKLSAEYNFGDEHDRKFRYSFSALKSVTLGINFFHGACVCTVADYEIDVQYRHLCDAVKVLDFLSDMQLKSGKIHVPIVRYATHKKVGEMNFLKINICKTGEMRYRIMEIV